MFDTVTLPVWMIGLLVLFAAFGIMDRVAAPGVRWFFRRRLNTAIDELNNRLDLGIQPFKLTRRQSLIDQLMYDGKVLEAVDQEARATQVPRAVVLKKAERYAREIVPSFSPLAYFGVGTRISRWLSQFIYRVRLGYSDDDKLKDIEKDAAVVFVMNHRSNMDYVLVTYMASSRATLSYAVGEWARVWGLQNVIRAMGAYFIRRKSRNELYRRVLARYVHMATQQGVTQAVFPEGGLSRDGELKPPKLGLLAYMVSDFEPTTGRDIVFIPVGINYDRVMEDRILTSLREQELTGRTFKVGFTSIFAVAFNLLKLRFQGKLYRLGYAAVSFGSPVSLKAYCHDQGWSFGSLEADAKIPKIEQLGAHLMTQVGQVIPVLPVSLVATVFQNENDRRLGELQLKSKVLELIEALERKGVHVHIPRSDRDYAVSTGLRMLTLRHLIVQDEEGYYYPHPKESTLMAYYANSIRHLLD